MSDDIIDITPTDPPADTGITTKPAAPRAWAPSPLALLSQQDFALRVERARLELERIREIRAAVMRENIDYGVIPGTNKPTLLQPGAQLLNRMAGFVASYRYTAQPGDGISAPTAHYIVVCLIRDADGFEVASGLGSANSWEKKHRYRNLDRACPACGQHTIMKSKYEPGWYCNAKRGGCGGNFPPHSEEARELEAQGVGQVDNPDPMELDNTLLKMAAKRALIAATVLAHACSGEFTQDLEDTEIFHQAPPFKPAAPQPPQSAGLPPGVEDPFADRPPKAKPQPAAPPAPRAPAASAPRKGGISEGQVKLCWARTGAKLRDLGIDPSEENKHKLRDYALAGACEDFESIPNRTALDRILEAITQFRGF